MRIERSWQGQKRTLIFQAYDSAVRKSGLEQHFCKINFDSEADYMKTRAKEIKSRKIDAEEVDLEGTLAMITDKVQHCSKGGKLSRDIKPVKKRRISMP